MCFELRLAREHVNRVRKLRLYETFVGHVELIRCDEIIFDHLLARLRLKKNYRLQAMMFCDKEFLALLWFPLVPFL